MDSGCDSLYWRNVDELRCIDISKGKSMIAVMRPFGEVVVSPFEVLHTDSELSSWQGCSKAWTARTRVVMESTGNYHAPVAWLLHDAGAFMSP